jgi:hypothetical protein
VSRPPIDCVQCKAAPAVVFVFFAELGNAAVGLPWCSYCQTNELPVLLHAGFSINLQSADKPPSLEICQYGQECPRLCKAGFRACSDHLTEMREVYVGKSSGANVALPGEVTAGTVADSNGLPADAFGQTLIGDTSWVPVQPTRGGYDR